MKDARNKAKKSTEACTCTKAIQSTNNRSKKCVEELCQCFANYKINCKVNEDPFNEIQRAKSKSSKNSSSKESKNSTRATKKCSANKCRNYSIYRSM